MISIRNVPVVNKGIGVTKTFAFKARHFRDI
jgi:hypothetical protein